jgi:PAS domain-containing protein
MATRQRPLELILARNLMSSLSTPAFLVDADGVVVFFNGAAEALLGVTFEEAGGMKPEEWGTAFGPFDEAGEQIPVEQLPLVRALRSGMPAHSRFKIRSLKQDEYLIEVSAMPIIAGPDASSGAMAIFWQVEDD